MSEVESTPRGVPPIGGVGGEIRVPTICTSTSPKLQNPKDTILEVQTRKIVDSDWNFILNSWLRSYRASCDWLPPKLYFVKKQGAIAKLRERGALFLIACDPEDEEHIFGWACAEAGVLHYAYVKEVFRHQGVFLNLLNGLGLTSLVRCTHWTKSFEQFARNKPGAFVNISTL